jgi:hypothetical protein
MELEVLQTSGRRFASLSHRVVLCAEKAASNVCFLLYLGGAEGELPDEASGAQLIGAQLLEAGYDPTASGDSDQLDLRAAHPSRKKGKCFTVNKKKQVDET